MAVRICLANSTLTAGTWKRSEAQNFGFVPGTYDDLNTARNLPITFANSGNQVGIVLICALRAARGTSTITIKLQDASGAVTYTTDVFNLTDYFSDLTWYAGSYNRGNTQVTYFPLTSYAVTAGAGLYRYNIQCNAASKLYWCRSASAGDYSYAAILDVDTSAPSSGDTLIVKNGCTLTNNASFTYAPTNNRSLFICEGATWDWENPAVASYTATFTGRIMPGSISTIQIGTAGSPITYASQAIVDCSGLSGSSWIETGSWSSFGQHSYDLYFYGEEDNYLCTRVTTLAANGQKDLVVEDNMQGIWQVGDVLALFGKGKPSGYNPDISTYTITGIVGTTITVNTNLDYPLYKKGGVLNTTRTKAQGIKFLGANGKYFCYNSTDFTGNSIRNFVMCGCYVYELPVISFGSNHINLEFKARRVFLDCTPTWAWSVGSTEYSCKTTMYQVFATTNNGNGTAISIGNYHSGSSFDTVWYKNGVYGLVTGGINSTFTKLAGYINNHGGYYTSLDLNGAGHVITDSLLGQAGCGLHVSTTNTLLDTTISNCTFEGMGSYGIYFRGNALNVTVENCEIGVAYSSYSYEVYINPYLAVKLLLKNCTTGGKGIYGVGDTLNGSYVKQHKYGGTANDHRSLFKYGNVASTGSGLSDTTVHTAGSGKFALREQPSSSVYNLADWTFTIPTGDISTKTMTIAVWCKINSATYYAGTHQKPKLTVRYDDTTDISCEATATTDWQLLVVNFTPATTYGEVTVTISTRTDATGSSAYVYFDDWSVLYPASYVLNLGGMDLWANALPITPPIATVFSAVDVWTAQTSVLDDAAGSIGKLLVDNVDTPISSRAPSATALSTAQWTNTRAGKLDNLDMSVSALPASVADSVFEEDKTGHSGWITKLIDIGRFLGLK